LRRLHLRNVAVDVERILGQITEVLQDDEEKARALDGGQIEATDIARIIAVEIKANCSAWTVPQRTRDALFNNYLQE